jgi:hypothetical protein
MQRFDLRGLLLDALVMRQLGRLQRGRQLLGYMALGLGVAGLVGVGLGVLIAPRAGAHLRARWAERLRPRAPSAAVEVEAEREDLESAFAEELAGE